MNEPVLRLDNVHKNYGSISVLSGIELDIYEGESVCILGSSGAGKSTLLHILGTLDQPTLGRVYYKGEELNRKPDEELAQFRNRELGFVFQFHHLLSEFTTLENVMLPVRLGGHSEREAKARALELLKLLGLESRQHHFPSELSGGEQQRVAVARALVQRPKILLADEPTGNLDTQNSLQIQELFFSFKARFGLTLVVVTHDTNFATRFPRRLTLKDGHWN
ncbi:MAG: ABC transporter ATP-binding protein [Bdellovibrionales bacterium RBG_16_40_8]|nr:MAG: ABC transporter ATP-binding protein [Bdellovibrionales bacterium RBG_16_40_8]